ncbi:MAG: dodecin domain-containing protein [Bacteroidetes bacterium]|nr:dodecin domain-containing protein [Bacteroidota bacterium]
MAVLKVIELMADSDKSWEDATKKAVAKASDTLKNVRSAFVQSQSVTVKEGKVDKFRINLKVTFEID